MASYVCPHCGYKFWSKPENRCTSCGYDFEYIDKYMKKSFAELKAPELGLIKIRHAVCSIPEKDTTKKGLHAYCTITNQGVLLEIFEKFEYGIFTNKKWKFNQNPRLMLEYENIVSITPASFKDKPASFYNYTMADGSVVTLCFSVDGASSSSNLDKEIKELVEKIMHS